MPMIDFYCPAGAMDDEARATALEKMTEALLRWEGAPDNERTRALSWGFIHELPRGAVNVAGRPAAAPVYRVSVTVPAGTLLHGPSPLATHQRAGLVRELTDIILEAEGDENAAADAGRVFCVIGEVANGFWGGMGALFPIQDIFDFAVNEDGGPDHVQAARQEVADGLFEPATARLPERKG
jgi:phenylpyruvate tautomerase PptA (4-oxalocrotonate tautomerase family)